MVKNLSTLFCIAQSTTIPPQFVERMVPSPQVDPRERVKVKTDRRLGLCRGVGLVFGAFVLSIFAGASVLAQSAAMPGPGTALAPQSEQSIRMPLLMPDDFSVLHLVA